MGIEAALWLCCVQPFLVCIDRFFLQSVALFRLFGHDTSGLSASMADQEGEILCSDRNDGKGWKKVMDKVGAMVAGGVMLLIFVCFRQE